MSASVRSLPFGGNWERQTEKIDRSGGSLLLLHMDVGEMAFTPGPFCFFSLPSTSNAFANFPQVALCRHCTTVRLAGADTLTGTSWQRQQSHSRSARRPNATTDIWKYIYTRVALISEALCHIHSQKPTDPFTASMEQRWQMKKKQTEKLPNGKKPWADPAPHTPIPLSRTPTSGVWKNKWKQAWGRQTGQRELTVGNTHAHTHKDTHTHTCARSKVYKIVSRCGRFCWTSEWMASGFWNHRLSNITSEGKHCNTNQTPR